MCMDPRRDPFRRAIKLALSRHRLTTEQAAYESGVSVHVIRNITCDKHYGKEAMYELIAFFASLGDFRPWRAMGPVDLGIEIIRTQIETDGSWTDELRGIYKQLGHFIENEDARDYDEMMACAKSIQDLAARLYQEVAEQKAKREARL